MDYIKKKYFTYKDDPKEVQNVEEEFVLMDDEPSSVAGADLTTQLLPLWEQQLKVLEVETFL